MEQRNGRDGCCHGSSELRESSAAQFAGDQAGQYDHGAERQGGGKPHADERWTEQGECDAREKRSERRVGDVAPCQVASIVERGEFIAMEAVPAIGQRVQDDAEGCEQQETTDFGLSDFLARVRKPRQRGPCWDDIRI